MKNVINYFYNLYPDKIYENKDIYYFYIDDIKFYFLRFERPLNELNSLVETSNELYNKGIMVHTFTVTTQNNFSVLHNESNYVLIRINSDEREDLDLQDLISFNNLITGDKTNTLYTEDWVDLWSFKIDTFEQQMIEFNKEYPILRNTFNYYIGLAENAISYAKNAFLSFPNDEKDKLYLSHRRINLPLNFGSLYNPLSFILDYEIRDFSEYIKAKFFKNEFDWDEIEEIFPKLNLNNLKIHLLYARLLYPSYYFDIFEKIIFGEIKEDEITKITRLSESYEEFLYEFYKFLKKYTFLPEIGWIVEKYKQI